MLRFSIYTLSIVHAEFNSSTLFPCQQRCQVTTSRQVSNVAMRGGGLGPHDREDLKFSSPLGPPRASGCMTAQSLQNTMTAKERDMGTRAYAVYMQFLWTAGVRGRKGAIKILQINYTKKKRQIIYIRKICTRPSLRRHHLYELCKGEKREGEDQY